MIPMFEIPQPVRDRFDELAYEDAAAGRCSRASLWRRRSVDLNVPSIDLPKRLGGTSLSKVRTAHYFAYCATHSLDLRDVPGAGHAGLLLHARTRRFDDFLSEVGKTDCYCAIAITEPGAGSDMAALTTRATLIDGGYRVDGAKKFVSRLEEATHAIVFAQVARGDLPPRLTAFLAPLKSKGVRVSKLRAVGFDGTSWGELTIDGLDVADSARIGGEGQGFQLFRSHFTYWRLAMAAAAIGAASRALTDVITRLKSRHSFGGPIGRFSHHQQELAIHTSKVMMNWRFVLDTMRVADEGHLPWLAACVAKAEAVECAISAVDWAMRVFGAEGYDEQTGLAKRFRDLLGLRIADGTTDVLRGQVARSFLGEEVYELSLGRNGIATGKSGASLL